VRGLGVKQRPKGVTRPGKSPRAPGQGCVRRIADDCASTVRLFPESEILRHTHFGRHIEMTPLCKVEVTLARVLGSREVYLGGGVDERAGVQPA